MSDDAQRDGGLIMIQVRIVSLQPAQPLYLALGFEMVDCSASYRKARS